MIRGVYLVVNVLTGIMRIKKNVSSVWRLVLNVHQILYVLIAMKKILGTF